MLASARLGPTFRSLTTQSLARPTRYSNLPRTASLASTHLPKQRQFSITATLRCPSQSDSRNKQPMVNDVNSAERSNSGHQSGSSGMVEAPNTGWNQPVPSSKGGSEEGYLFRPPYVWHTDEFKVKWTSACWCNKVKFEWHGDPVDAKHCHCTQCQRLHGAPFQYAALYHKTSVRLAADCDPMYLDFFSTHRRHSEHDVPCKVSCRNCRSPLMDEGRNMVMAYPSSFDFPDGHIPSSFAPSCHIFYGEAIIEVDDGVPKWEGHKDHSKLLPHRPGRLGKLGHGQSGKQSRGEDGDDPGLTSKRPREDKEEEDSLH